ncbi:AAA family ATPase [Candidatus Obscuribacterales bacterium]|nr:AAA family ATPase [Candidatus Obscuribacterales bacterium]MBX3149086.1 AAA family ATPase [Candidatus Obscuribacterales bacterium]
MWIEKITLYGFGGITNEEIEFGSDELNLIVESNEYGKSTLAEGIWATLFDFPEHGSKAAIQEREHFKPWEEKAPYKAVLELRVDDRPLRITRNFETKEVEVFDRSTNQDVTAEFTSGGKDHTDGDTVGFKITGMSRDLFRNTCLLGQRHLDAHHVGGSSDIAPVFQGMADTASPVSTAGGAIESLNDALQNYTFAGASSKKMSVEDAIKELEASKTELHQKLTQMDIEFRKTSELLEELNSLDEDVEENEPVEVDPTLASEFDAYRLELKELERKLDSASQRYEQKLKLEEDLRAIDMAAPISASAAHALKDLWTRKQSRQTDADRLAEDITPQQEEYERLEQEIRERYKNLESLTVDEANSISALAISLYKLQQDLNDLQRQHKEQTGMHLQKLMVSSKQAGAALDVLKSLTKVEIEEAKNYSSLLIMFYEQVQEEQKRIQEVKFSIDDIEERRRHNRNANTGKMLGCFVAAIVCVVFLIFSQGVKEIPQIAVIATVCVFLLAFLAGLVFAGMILNFKYYLKDDAASASEEEQKHKKALAAVKTKIANLESKLTALAVKTGTPNREDLIRFINEASTHEDVLSEQENRDQSLGNEEARMRKIQRDLAYFFDKAGRDSSVIDSQRAMDLSQDIQQYHKEREALEAQFNDIRTTRKQLDFLLAEIEDSARELEILLERSGVEVVNQDEIENKINELLQSDVDRQAVQNEIAKIDYDLAGYQDAREAITNMEFERDVIKDKIRNLIHEYPDLQHLPEPDESAPKKAVLPWGATPEPVATTKKAKVDNGAKKEELLVQIRTAMNYRDEHYLETVEDLANIDHELTCAKRAKLALTMARDVISKLSSETYEDWSQELNKESERLISQLNMDIESMAFDHSLRMVFKLKGHDREFSSHDVAKLSTGTREQIHWLARIILSSFLSKRQSLPIVLDEPFSEADDARFLSMMRFLINSIAPHNQIIILSCHHQRHQWLASQLSATEQGKLSFRTRRGALSMN